MIWTDGHYSRHEIDALWSDIIIGFREWPFDFARIIICHDDRNFFPHFIAGTAIKFVFRKFIDIEYSGK